MQAAKTLLILLALGLCVGTVSQARPDTEAQAKAREALRKKMAELEGQPATPTPAAAPAPAVPPKPAKAPKATPPPKAVAAPVAAAPVAATPVASGTGASPAPAAGTATPEQIERLRETTRQKIAESNAEGKSAPASVATPPPAAVVVESSPAAAPPSKSTAEVRAEEKAAAATAAAETKRLAEEEKARSKAEAAAAKAKPAPKGPSFDPIPAPPSNLADSKETRLADLLKKYKAEEITPEQYHTERAKILAEK